MAKAVSKFVKAKGKKSQKPNSSFKKHGKKNTTPTTGWQNQFAGTKVIIW